MISLIPQTKQWVLKEGAGFSHADPLLVELRLEQADPRLERHCRRLFPGAVVRAESASAGYAVRIGRANNDGDGARGHADEQGLSVDAATAAGKREGYDLQVDESGATIRASDAAGLFYGLQTFRQLMEHNGEAPAGTIADWPDTALRCMNYDLRQTYSKPERLVSYLADFARYKVNGLLIEYEDKFPFENYPELAHPKHALSREQFEELKREAREYFIEIIPLQQSFGHLEYVLRHDRYKHLRETEKSIGELCPSREESFELVTGLLAEMMDRHPDSRYIHLGCDEVYSLCECETCREQYDGVRERAFIAFLNRLIVFTAERGKSPIFWHDMLDKCPEEELRKLDKRGIAMIWIYNGRNIDSEVSALTAKFRKLGIGVMGAPAVRSFDWAEHQNYPVIVNRVDNLLQWTETSEKLGIDCMVATNWTGPFSLGVPYGVFETTWYPMLLHADLCWNRGGDPNTFIDRFLQQFHGVEPSVARAKLGNYRIEDYYDIIWKLRDEVQVNRDYAELIAIMHDYEKATDRSRAIHKYLYRWELFPGDPAERRSLLNNYQRNRLGREAVRLSMQAELERYQRADMAEHFVLSRFYLHDYLEQTIYRELGLNLED
ncbi:glycoside hydrolase family 20 zincin-like fold domain-containing protein [Paenibacillus sp. PL91]|uniref:glycoside hydrolase family 20 zincin-like fold domain-containing protein n=1 Tax=Paenibacillus sp. PL91 TaxID=2729538 RepID=UPI00145F3096|nr:glycoside hydrolase family 20 zincin-like fold domain-containing protein [Paenibacillus sp. PL91]MBC9205041.1 family 20 glycosylhydrolase [Paenibacillus sp. PL91]